MGKQILPGSWNQLGRARDAGGAIQKEFFEFAFGDFHVKNINML